MDTWGALKIRLRLAKEQQHNLTNALAVCINPKSATTEELIDCCVALKHLPEVQNLLSEVIYQRLSPATLRRRLEEILSSVCQPQ